MQIHWMLFAHIIGCFHIHDKSNTYTNIVCRILVKWWWHCIHLRAMVGGIIGSGIGTQEMRRVIPFQLLEYNNKNDKKRQKLLDNSDCFCKQYLPLQAWFSVPNEWYKPAAATHLYLLHTDDHYIQNMWFSVWKSIITLSNYTFVRKIKEARSFREPTLRLVVFIPLILTVSAWHPTQIFLSLR